MYFEYISRELLISQKNSNGFEVGKLKTCINKNMTSNYKKGKMLHC